MRASILFTSALAAVTMATPFSLEKKDVDVAAEALPPTATEDYDFDDFEKRGTETKHKRPIASTYRQAVIQHHNFHRRNNSAPNIKWSQGLADTAMEIAKNCVYAHNMSVGTTPYGQNIAAGYSASAVSYSITNLFYNNEEPNYTDYGSPNGDMDTFGSWGHYSQLVWKATTHVGCATWQCPSLQNIPSNSGIAPIITVCNYSVSLL